MEISPIYTSDKTGSDDKGEGTVECPFKTALQAMRHWGKVCFNNVHDFGAYFRPSSINIILNQLPINLRCDDKIPPPPEIIPPPHIG